MSSACSAVNVWLVIRGCSVLVSLWPRLLPTTEGGQVRVRKGKSSFLHHETEQGAVERARQEKKPEENREKTVVEVGVQVPIHASMFFEDHSLPDSAG